MVEYQQVVKFASPEAVEIFKDEVRKSSWFEERFGAQPGSLAMRYDGSRFPFRDRVRELLRLSPDVRQTELDSLMLEDLHLAVEERAKFLDVSEVNGLTQQFYDLGQALHPLYRDFVDNVLCPIVGSGLIYQQTPTIRFHFPTQPGVRWRPQFHCDVMLGHPPQEMNVWLPMTKVVAGNGIRIADLHDSLTLYERYNYDFDRLARDIQENDRCFEFCERITRPVELEFGEFLMFDARCLHVTQHHRESPTRISMDFRVVPVEIYKNLPMTYTGTGRRRMLFQQGHYYAAGVAYAQTS